MRPDIVIVGPTTDDLSDKDSRKPKIVEADKEQTTLKDMIGAEKTIILEIRYVADTGHDDKCKAKIQQYRSLCHILEEEGHGVKFYPIILMTQASFFYCFKAAISAV